MKSERVAGGGDLGAAVLALAAEVLVEGDAALRRVAGLAEVGRERLEVVEGDVRGDVDRVRAQQLAQERVAHRLALEVVDDVLAHVAGADAEIDRVVEPVRLLAQHRRDAGLAEARHAEERDPLVAARAASPRASRRSCARLAGASPRPSLAAARARGVRKASAVRRCSRRGAPRPRPSRR